MSRFSGRSRRQQRAPRRKSVVAGVLAIGLLAGGAAVAFRMVGHSDLSPSDTNSTLQSGTNGAAERLLLPTDVTGGARVGVDLRNGQPRQLLQMQGSKWIASPGPLTLDGAQIRIQQTNDGPLVVWMGQLPGHAPFEVKLPDPTVVPAAGGEPTFKAWAVTNGKLQPVDYYQAVAPTPPAPTSIIVDKGINALWLYKNGKLTLTKRIATGRYLQAPFPNGQNQADNSVTPLGTFTIGTKKVDPIYYHDNISGGDPRNPLGTRFLGLNIYPGDNAGVWAIHGTNEPNLLGQWVSDGCVRMNTKDVEQLFEMVNVGTVVQIVDSYHPKG